MGGAGTVAFLVGAARIEGDRVILDQCFMRDFDEEEPMLAYLDEVFRRSRTLVTYNGKSFDMPLLRTRFIANRLPFRLDGALHFDLVHAARRFWKRRLGDCSLASVERSILGLERHGDIPSAEIPQIWLDYIRTRDARSLQRVFYHHKMDILSLVSLTGLLSQRLETPDGAGFNHAEDRLSLVRIHFRQKRYADVARLGSALLEIDLEPSLLRECLEMLGYAYKRLGNWQAMEDAWSSLHTQFPHDLLARHELAKHYEHRKRDLFAAERICRETLDYIDTRTALGRDADAGSVASFRRRLERIQRKLKRARPGQDEFA